MIQLHENCNMLKQRAISFEEALFMEVEKGNFKLKIAVIYHLEQISFFSRRNSMSFLT